MTKFNINKKFPLIIIPFQSIQELIKPEDQESCFIKVYKHLTENGRFIVTTHNNNQTSDLNTLKLVGEFTNPKTKNKVLFYLARTTNSKKHTGTAYQLYEEYTNKSVLKSKKLFKNEYYIFEKGELT